MSLLRELFAFWQKRCPRCGLRAELVAAPNGALMCGRCEARPGLHRLSPEDWAALSLEQKLRVIEMQGRR